MASKANAILACIEFLQQQILATALDGPGMNKMKLWKSEEPLLYNGGESRVFDITVPIEQDPIIQAIGNETEDYDVVLEIIISYEETTKQIIYAADDKSRILNKLKTADASVPNASGLNFFVFEDAPGTETATDGGDKGQYFYYQIPVTARITVTH